MQKNKKWWNRAMKEELRNLRKQIAEACYSTGLDIEEIERLIQSYANLSYLILNGEFIKDE